MSTAALGALAWMLHGHLSTTDDGPPLAASTEVVASQLTATMAADATPAREQAAVPGAPTEASTEASTEAVAVADPSVADVEAAFAQASALEAAGSLDDARRAYHSIVAAGSTASPSQPPVHQPLIAAAAAAYARIALAEGDNADALSVLEGLRDAVGLEGMPAAGLYHLGVALEEAGRFDEAMTAYCAYGEQVPAMSDLSDMAIGQLLFSQQLYEEAAAAYSRARQSAGDGSTAFLAALRRGNALLRAGPPAGALAAYEDAFALAGDDTQRAQALSGSIAVHEHAGDGASAAAARLRLVRSLPTTEFAATALANLETSGITVTLTEAAAVYSGRGDHVAATSLLREAIADAAAEPETEAPGELYALLVAEHAAAGDHVRAVAIVDDFLAERPSDSEAPDLAWLRIRSLQRLGRETELAEACLDFADRWPIDERAGSALLTRALVLQDLVPADEAEEAFRDAALRYPRSPEGIESRFKAGLIAYMAHRAPHAAEHWTVLAESNDAGLEDKARARFWLGRMASDLGNQEVAAQNWRSAVALDPNGFHGLKAMDRLGLPIPTARSAEGERQVAVGATGGVEEAAVPDRSDDEAGASASGLGFEPVAAAETETVAEVGRWLAGWRPDAAGAAWDAVVDSVSTSRDMERARAWQDLGRASSAYRQLRSANADLWNDPVRQAALALMAHAMGEYRVSSSAAENVLAVAPAGSRSVAPSSLERIAYPDAYGDLIRATAAEFGIAPVLLFALVRQESRFDPNAVSSAGASGLTQVMPTTGRQIAAQLGDAGFEASDLFQPATAVRYGASYLATQLAAFDGLEVAALAAYNGGPGNARRWLDASGGDIDLYAELIDFKETRRYVRLVSEHRAQYVRLYPTLLAEPSLP